MGTYSKEQVRGFARDVANGKKLDSDRQAALDRSTNQAGPEGRRLERLKGGGKD